MMGPIGIVPSGWTAFTLGDLLDFSNGINAEKSSYGSGTPFANVLEVITNDYLDEVLIPGRIDLPQNTLNRYRVQHGDVLFNRTSETQEDIGLSSVYVGKNPVVFGGFVLRGQPKTSDVSVGFSKYCFRSRLVRQQIVARGQGGIRSNIGQRDLKTVQIAIPPVREQNAIAAALDDASASIACLERLLVKKQAIKQGMIQRLLTGETRLPGFAEAWSATTLGALGTFVKGRGVKRDDVRGSGVPCIRYGELYTAFRDYAAEARSFVAPEIAATALALRTGDVLFAGSGETRDEIGKCVAYVGPTPAVAGGDVIVLRSDQCNAIYLALLANTPEVVSQKARAGQGDAVVHIYTHALAAIEVTLPPRTEQDAITGVIVSADREIRLLKDRLAKAVFVKQAMMQELLTGRTRLPVVGAAV
jgi:type I restriction enzyme S subunit